MATSAKKKAAQAKRLVEEKPEKVVEQQRCTCLVSIRGRGLHAIDCAVEDY